MMKCPYCGKEMQHGYENTLLGIHANADYCESCGIAIKNEMISTNWIRYVRIITDKLHTNRKPQCCATGVSFRREDRRLSLNQTDVQYDQAQTFFHSYYIFI